MTPRARPKARRKAWRSPSKRVPVARPREMPTARPRRAFVLVSPGYWKFQPRPRELLILKIAVAAGGCFRPRDLLRGPRGKEFSSPSARPQYLDRLKDNMLLERRHARPHEDDARAVWYSITKAGRIALRDWTIGIPRHRGGGKLPRRRRSSTPGRPRRKSGAPKERRRSASRNT